MLLLAYEWGRQSALAPAAEPAEGEAATHLEIEKLAEHYESRLDEAGFFFPETKAAHMKLNLRNLWSRLPLNRAEVQIFHGMLRQLTRRRD